MPLKSVTEAKSRLVPLLSPPQRADLMRAMVTDVLAALCQLGHRCRVQVLLGAGWDSETLAGPNITCTSEDGYAATSFNDLLSQVLAESVSRHRLVVFADLPLLTPAGLSELMSVVEDRHPVICPDRASAGTNILGIPAGCSVVTRYGLHSFQRHVAGLADHAVQVKSSTATGLDIDTPEDLALLAALDRSEGTLQAGHATRAWLAGQALPEACQSGVVATLAESGTAGWPLGIAS